MTTPAPGPAPAYIAFISYAREDEAFARQLETEIEAWPRPPGQDGPVRVFRDRSDFTGSAYEADLEEHLRASAALIVLCSPHARRSDYVGDEIARFARLGDPTRIFPILVAGLPDNEADEQKAFPPALLKAMQERGMPLGAEFRGIDLARERLSGGRFESEWYKLLGNLFQAPPSEIQAQDQHRLMRQQRRRWMIAATAFVALAALLGLFVMLWWNAQAAEQRAVKAERQAGVDRDRAETLAADLARARTGPTRPEAAPPGPEPEPVPAPAPAPGPTQPPVQPPATPPPAAPQTPPSSTLAPRVYVHIRDEAQRDFARSLARAIESGGLGVVVPGIQRLDVGPTTRSELRYFRDAEQAEAERIGSALRAAGAGDLLVKKVPGYETSTRFRPRHFELWLRPGAGQPAGG